MQVLEDVFDIFNWQGCMECMRYKKYIYKKDIFNTQLIYLHSPRAEDPLPFSTWSEFEEPCNQQII